MADTDSAPPVLRDALNRRAPRDDREGPTGRGVDVEVRLDNVAAQVGGRTIWSGASVSVRAGEFVAILGPNGSGKSSLLRLLLGLLRPSQGTVEVFGEPPHRGNPAIGYMPQRRALDAGAGIRGKDLVALGIDGHRWGFGLPGTGQRRKNARVNEVIAAVGASAYAGRPVGELSGGERQRILLAQALVGAPRLLLLDEPLAGLDVRSQMATAQLIARLARAEGLTALLVAHDVNPLLPVIDRVLYIARGAVATGTPEEIITTERLSALYDAPVEVVRDKRGRVFVVGLEDEVAHPHQAQEFPER